MPESAPLPSWGSDLVSQLAVRLVGRQESHYKAALDALDGSLREAIEGRRILVLGAAGFIARKTLSVILRYRPDYVGLVDISENGLAEVIRWLRASGVVPPSTTIDPWLADIGGPNFIRLVRSVGHVDRVLNFAAVKHVRSERDVPSLLRMLEVNLVGIYASAVAVEEHAPGTPQFFVSTDKASDPSNFMGASKRAMEIAIASLAAPTTTVRFANVAFSSGSLLESWLFRLGDRQPLVVPESTWRYFVTPEESGELCAAAAVAQLRSAVIPHFAASDLILLEDALCTTLEFFGLDPVRVDGIDEARAHITRGAVGKGYYPYFVTPLDTMGEKTAESLVGSGEKVWPWLPGLDVMPLTGQPEASTNLIAWLTNKISCPGSLVSTEEIGRQLSTVVPNFRHGGGTSQLDDRV